MMWQKESNNPNALHIDLVAKYRHDKRFLPPNSSLVPPKNEETATLYRKIGNQLYGEKKWYFALEKYNDCLRFADPKSTNKSFGYANRSACFYHMELYNESLADIELAKATGYPQNLLPKLDRRRNDCMKRIEEGAKRDEFGLKLSFEPNEKFPCMADVLNFERDADGSYSLFAKEDIDVGQTIVREKEFIQRLFTHFGLQCNICLKENCNLMPCDSCTEAMFCSDGCRTRHYHECGIRFFEDSKLNGTLMRELRLIMQVIRMFSSMDELMKFVQDTINSDSKEMPESLTDEKSKYRAFLKLPMITASDENLEYFTVVLVYNQLMNDPYYALKFKSEKHRRFITHLMVFHLEISNQNGSYATVRPDTIDYNNLDFFGGIDILSTHTELMLRYLKGSCSPNVASIEHNDHSVYYTIRPVKKGEKLLRNISGRFTDSKEKRHQLAKSIPNEPTCECERSKEVEVTPLERRQLTMDPEYSKILNDELPLSYTKATLMAMTDNCAKFLQKYGHIKWCDEIAIVLDKYVEFQHIRSSGAMNWTS